MQAEAGKGSKPRKQQDHNAYADGYDRIFSKKKSPSVEEMLTKLYNASEDSYGICQYALDWLPRGELDPTAVEQTFYFNSYCTSVNNIVIDGHLLAIVYQPLDWEGTYQDDRSIVIAAFPVLSTSQDSVTVDVTKGKFIRFDTTYSSLEGVLFSKYCIEVHPKPVMRVVYE